MKMERMRNWRVKGQRMGNKSPLMVMSCALNDNPLTGLALLWLREDKHYSFASLHWVSLDHTPDKQEEY